MIPFGPELYSCEACEHPLDFRSLCTYALVTSLANVFSLKGYILYAYDSIAAASIFNHYHVSGVRCNLKRQTQCPCWIEGSGHLRLKAEVSHYCQLALDYDVCMDT